MEKETKAIKATGKINYQFIAFPSNILYLCSDTNINNTLLILINKQTYWESLEELDENGYFFMSMEDLCHYSLCDKRIMIHSIEALYRSKIVDVISKGTTNNKATNYYKINIDRIEELNKLSYEQCKLEKYKIKSVKRGEEITYRLDTTKPCTQAKPQALPKSHTTLKDINCLNKSNDNICIQKEESLKEEQESIINVENKTNYLIENNSDKISSNMDTKILEIIKKKNTYIYQVINSYIKGEYTKDSLFGTLNSYKRNYTKAYELIEEYISPILDSLKDDSTENLPTIPLVDGDLDEDSAFVIESFFKYATSSNPDSTYNQIIKMIRKRTAGNNTKYLEMLNEFDELIKTLNERNPNKEMKSNMPSEATISEMYKIMKIEDKEVSPTEVWN